MSGAAPSREWTWLLVPLLLWAVATGQILGSCGAAADDRVSEASARPGQIAVPTARSADASFATLSATEREAALTLWRTAANESDTLSDWGEALLIWQAAEAHYDTLGGRTRWLREHSSRCVFAVTPAADCRKPWARVLDPSGREPSGWPRGASWAVWRPLALGLLEYCARIVSGEITERPCPEPPDTWDGRRWLERAIARGYTPLDCRDPATGEHLGNEGFRFPER